ncbi:MAG TPA: hypothetical protein V6D05_12750 [Stenomitos sp.]
MNDQKPKDPQAKAEINLAQLAMRAFVGTEVKHRPRSPGKAELLRSVGSDPDKAFASA